MTPQRSVRAALRSRAPGLMRRVGRLVRRSRGLGAGGDVIPLTVILDADDTQSPFIDQCLKRLRRERPLGLEILVVAHGPSEVVRRRAARHADDARIKVLPERFDTRAEARNAGVGRARGMYLAFVTASDLVAPGAYQQMFRSLCTTGSDFAVGAFVVRRGRPQSSRLRVDQRNGSRLTLKQLPEAISDTTLGNRMFSRAFWVRNKLSFDPTSHHHENLPVAKACIASSGFDVINAVVYGRYDRALGRPVGALGPLMPLIASWWNDVGRVGELLAGVGDKAVQDAWLVGILDGAILPYLDDAERATDAEWRVLSRAVRWCLDEISTSGWSSVKAENKVRCWLAGHDQRSDLETFVARRWNVAPHVVTRRENDTFYAELPFFGDDEIGVPRACFELAEADAELTSSLRGVRWQGASTLECEAFIAVKRVDMGQDYPEVKVQVRDESGAVVLEPSVTQRTDRRVTRWVGDRFQQHDHGVISFAIDCHDVVRQAGSWTLSVDLTMRGISRSGRLGQVAALTSAGYLWARQVGGLTIRPGKDGEGHFVIQAVDAPVRLVSFENEGRHARGTVSTQGAKLRAIVARHGDVEISAPFDSHGGTKSFALEVPQLDLADQELTGSRWRVRAALSDGTEIPIGWPEDEPRRWVGICEDAVVVLGRTNPGNIEFDDVTARLCVHDVSVDESTLTFTTSWLGRQPEGWEVALDSASTSVAPRTIAESDGVTTVAFPTTQSSWGREATALNSGRYRLVVRYVVGSDVVSVPSYATDELIASTSTQTMTSLLRAELMKGPAQSVVLEVSAPLPEEERGAFAQQKLRQRFRDADPGTEENAVYLQSYKGHVCSDSVLAVHEELRRRGAPYTLYWGVRDYAAPTPQGAVPLLIHSAQWYEKLATARYLVKNTDFPWWFDKLPHQSFLQTFHGYPSKAMGLRLWRDKNFTPRRLESELQRTSAGWDLILTPTPEMNEHYRREYAYEGPIFDRGYPRNDVFASAQAPVIRQRTRELLGVRDDQVVVMYAPTWRDDVATGYESAPMVSHLDVGEAAEALGDDFVLLMRGHRFHAPGRDTTRAVASVIDVSDYPEVNDLILATDVGIFDYSSMRFDFALTGRPMLFLVPDLDSYAAGGRGFLFDYRSSAPGPLLESTADVVDALKRLPEVEAEHAATYAAFNERFNAFQDGRAAERLVDTFFDLPPLKDEANR